MVWVRFNDNNDDDDNNNNNYYNNNNSIPFFLDVRATTI